ncbi:tRNA N6-adenosine threonylcarbamoyltransferase, mitochondrial [Anthonomus grandis grandis]|uniref:tRNA N6-adenosine threonylcarbamoyltransferase, mitochondrial n=1 Tax=Anthonomus grandis grandis TaxID=2921223 RepID=UPI0021655FFC|nr:tRNA N6-adenosine threonylcarbamoyltransferase, mitochondrial [Anthonomus grandis grandis]
MALFYHQIKLFHKFSRLIHQNVFRYKHVILGIETSCDDTGCAIVDTEGNLLGEALHSQHLVHLNNGGIIPPLAGDLHRQNIESVVKKALDHAQMRMEDVDAVATTIKPGLPLSLTIGTKYGKYLCKKYKKPFIPIHHMEAHALTARMTDKTLQFPFLVLLISGGHCLLAIAETVDKFWLLGDSIDDAPGEAFDKMARRMKLRNLPEYSTLSGGQAIELAATKATDPLQFNFNIPMTAYKDCQFSFAGVKNVCTRHIMLQEKLHDVAPDAVIPDVNNLCASFLLVITRHLCHRLQRGIEYVERKELIPPDRRTLVVSGGVACNNFIAEGLKLVCDEFGYQLVRPPPKLCTDNGIMIAWNGVERWKANKGVYENFDDIEIEKTSPLGVRIVDDVAKENISCKWVKLTKLAKPKNEWDSFDKAKSAKLSS